MSYIYLKKKNEDIEDIDNIQHKLEPTDVNNISFFMYKFN